jgi:hypothetical protein
MSNLDYIYVTKEDARRLLLERRADTKLIQHVEAVLGKRFIPEFAGEPKGVVWKYIISPEHGFVHYLQLCKQTDVSPLFIEYLDDVFLTLNEEKKGLGRLRVTLPDGRKGTVDIMDFPPNQKKLMSSVLLKSGKKLVDFHHGLFGQSGYVAQVRDNSQWAHDIGKPVDYYYPYLAHFLVHGILFESYLTEDPDEREVAFTREVVAPTVDRLITDFGVQPLIVRLFPEEQNEEDDFYWWSYPPHVNDMIVEYVTDNKLPINLI